MKRVSLVIFIFLSSACVHEASDQAQLKQPKIARGAALKKTLPVPVMSPVRDEPTVAREEFEEHLPTVQAPKVDPNCLSLKNGIKLPFYHKAGQVVAIGFINTCDLQDGTKGFVRGSPWTAMGFPCSQGRGRIDKRGSSDNRPGLVSFSLQNACPMQPGSMAAVEQSLRPILGIPNDSRLAAYYPMSVDYWEFTQYPERDIGFIPQIYSPQGLNKGWTKFSTQNESLKIKLYGRENSWERGHFLFEVEAEMVSEGRNQFRLQLNNAKSLDSEAIAKVKERCASLRPVRDCDSIFD